MNDELKPCPFCGSEDIEPIDFAVDFSTRPHIRCNYCGVNVYDVPNVVPIWHRNDSMVLTWNTRANDIFRTLEAEHALAMQLQDDTDRLRAERDELKSELNECKESLAECNAYCRYLQDKLTEYEKGQTDER